MNTASNTQKAIKGMSSQAIVTLMLGIVEIVSFSIMSRLLTQEDFGYYAALTAITTIFTSFSETGMGAAIIQRKDATERFINNAFTISFIVAIAVSTLLVLLSYPLAVGITDETMTIPLMIMSIPLFCHCLSSVQCSIVKKRLEFLKLGAINLTSMLLSSIVAIVLAFYGYGYYAIITRGVLSGLLVLLMSHIAAKTRFHFAIDKETFKQIFGFSGWLTASVLFRNFAHQMDRLLMSNLLSVSTLGAYNRPKEFINQISNKINGIFDTALFPVLSGIQDDMDKVRRAYLRSFYYMNIFALVLSALFFFNSELIIRIFLGEKWMSVLLTMQILSCMLLFNMDARLADCYLRSMGWTKQQFYFRIFEVVMQIAGLAVGSLFGINGVATSVLIVNIIIIWSKNIYITKKINIEYRTSISTILHSWRLGVILIPIMIMNWWLLPHSLAGNCINLIIFSIVILISFIFKPTLVGNQYKNDMYLQVVKFVNKKFHFKIKTY